MDTGYKEKVELVICHTEGCGGNFLACLYCSHDLSNIQTFRTDTWSDHPKILSTDSTTDWENNMDRWKGQTIVVTHQFDRQKIYSFFPNARVIQIFPKSCLGNVLWNISHKKLKHSIDNILDSHCIQIKEWWQRILEYRKTIDLALCFDYGDLNNKELVQGLLGINFNQSQQDFWDRYWQCQLGPRINVPDQACGMKDLIAQSGIHDRFDHWSIAFAIVVFEHINQLDESQRLWSIDDFSPTSWDDVVALEYCYKLKK